MTDDRKVYIGSAPGRLDVMGGIADYSGSLVLQMPLNLYTTVSIRKRMDTIINLQSSLGAVEIELFKLLKERDQIIRSKKWETFNLPAWSRYVLGCLFVLLDERTFEFKGLDIQVESEVPIGKGVSSSAALEIATLCALYQTFDLPMEREQLALMGQRAENVVAKAPCGIMDQIAVHLGREGQLLPILCQPCEVLEPIDIPAGFKFFGLDTGVKHSVGGGSYGKVRMASVMGLRIIQHQFLKEHPNFYNKLKLEGKRLKTFPFDNYLANISVPVFEEKYLQLLPAYLSGKDFVEHFLFPVDLVTGIDSTFEYPVLAATIHPIYEHDRITRFKKILESKNPDPITLGKLMLESHQGYVNCGLSCPEADWLVEAVRKRVEQGQVFGARITGGGSGGTVCILARSEAVVQEIKVAYESIFGHTATLFNGSGEGSYYKS